MTSLTDTLLESEPLAFERATHHPFLRAAGDLALQYSTLLSWLAQDRLYTHAYVNFIGCLLSKIKLSSDGIISSTLEGRIVIMLGDALNNILREITLFDKILGSEHVSNITDSVEPRPRTEVYTNMLRESVHPQSSLLVDLTILWGTEKCYLEAWRYAKSCDNSTQVWDSNSTQDPNSRSLLQETLIPNWTSSEFEDFVRHIEYLLNELASHPDYVNKWQDCRDMWSTVLAVEENFWPLMA